ncbi:hypothetical protein CRE_18854 [Caenorhabditis remanei]|uniref:Uncharacterized protein n=1 Tax=Caenorhabditis remanei TaxID=31234 RepID=E3LL40_CAERE|nr:hypothetical protein CRE_18854 [Caenorhabditis remanei]
MAFQPILHEFSVLQRFDRSPQLSIMNFINLISIVIHAFLFYLTINENQRRESKTYRVLFIIKTVTLWLSQLHWGSLHSLVFLFPFSGLYGIGYLSSVFSSFALVVRILEYRSVFVLFYFQNIWLNLFCTTVFMLYLILILRLRTLARTESKFSFSSSTYVVFISILLVYCYVPMIFCWLSAYSTASEIHDYVSKYYPRCVKVLNVRGVFVYTDDWKFQRIIYCARIVLATGGALYLILNQIILYEIQQQCKTLSSHILKYHRKAMKDTLIQNVILFLFLALAPFIQIWNAYKTPEEDTINLTIAANLIFVSAPIPCTLTVIFQNSSYREFIFSKIGFQDRERTRIDSTHHVPN